MIIEVCGPGCPRCQATEKNVLQALKELGKEAEVVKVKDFKEISARGVMMTPAVIIDGVKAFEGRIPSAEEIKNWLQEKA
jgi:small redox-active disulfide protein 2